jgi:hypothetical protein
MNEKKFFFDIKLNFHFKIVNNIYINLNQILKKKFIHQI